MTTMTIDNAMQLATQWQAEGQLAAAEKILNRILQATPNHAQAWHLLGVMAHQVGKTSLGIELIQKALAIEPTIALFHSNLGEMHRQLCALDLSIMCGQRAVTLAPNVAIFLSNLGVAYYDAKDYERAESCHRRALELNPHQSNSLNNMGSLHKERKNLTEAKRYYQAAILSSPHYADPLNNLGALLVTEQQFAHALELLNRAITLSPEFPDAHCNLGFAYHGLDNNDMAWPYFQRALQLRPHYAEAYIGLSKIHSKKNDFETAKCHAQRAIELNPHNAEFYQCLAEICREQCETKEALSYLDHALSIDPELGSAQISKGNLLVELGEVIAAEALLSSAKNDPSAATQLSAHCSLVQLRTVKPNDQSMRALLAIANNRAHLAPSQQEYLHFSLGKCYDDIGQYATAFEHFNLGCQHGAGELSHLSIITDRSVETPTGARRYPENIFYLTPTACRAIADEYLRCLQHHAPTATRITDKMPGNFVTIGLIHALLPNAKIIHVERNPIDTCLSCYTKLFQHGQFFSYDLIELAQFYADYQRLMAQQALFKCETPFTPHPSSDGDVLNRNLRH